jgi:dienelactone hydrolase
MQTLIPLTLGLLMVAILSLPAQSTPASPLPWAIATFKEAPVTFPAPDINEEGVKSIYFQGPAYHGKPTRVFAFYGIPAHADGVKVPGIVLVHGGGGTAFAYWVKLWNSRGYAAIALDHSGGLPIGTMGAWKPNPDGGPSIGMATGAPEDSWVYHVVADCMLATSLLQSFPEVDPNRIGLTGISWGGVAASAVAGFDDRLKFIVPVYGCGFVDYHAPDDPVLMLPANWDPSNYLPHATAPMLWVDGSNDHFFTLNAVQQSYRAAPVPHTLCTRVRMPHGQYGVASDAPEILAFANSLVNSETPLAQLTDQSRGGDSAWVCYSSPHPIVSAEFNYTRDGGLWEQRAFITVPAKLDKAAKKASHEVVEGTTGYYFNLVDDRNLIVSSEYVSIDATAPNVSPK